MNHININININKPQTFQLTERDLLVMSWVGTGGIASIEQIASRYWSGAKLSTAKARLQRLVSCQYLKSRWVHVRSEAELVYTLTRGGYELLPPLIRDRVQVSWPPRGEILQQLLANDARILIEAQLKARNQVLIDWRSARELKAAHAKEQAKARWEGRAVVQQEVADAQMVISTAGGRLSVVDIEIDGQYFGSMLRAKAGSYSRSGRPVLWVCTPNRANQVQRAIQPYRNISLLVLDKENSV